MVVKVISFPLIKICKKNQVINHISLFLLHFENEVIWRGFFTFRSISRSLFDQIFVRIVGEIFSPQFSKVGNFYTALSESKIFKKTYFWQFIVTLNVHISTWKAFEIMLTFESCSSFLRKREKLWLKQIGHRYS